MRIVTLVLATLLLLASTGLGVLGYRRVMDDAKGFEMLASSASRDAIAAVAAGPQSKVAQELARMSEKVGLLKVGAILLGLAGLVSLVLLVLTYADRKVKLAAGVLAVLAVAAVLVNPSYDLGKLAKGSPRELAYVVAGLALVGALCAYGASALKARRAVAA